MEEKERRLAVDIEEEEEGIVTDEGTDLKKPVSGAMSFFPWERKLICVDETSKVCLLLCYEQPRYPIIMW